MTFIRSSFVFVGLFVLALPAFAAPQYQVAPLIFTEDAEARDILTREITITNSGTSPVTVYPSVNNISLTDGGKIEEFVPRVESEKDASLAAWIEISRAGVHVPSGGEVTVPVTLRIHPKPVPGEYHAFVGFGYGRNRDEAEAQVKRGDAPGTIITVRIVDTKVEALRLGTFAVDRFVTKGENGAVEYTITNPGDTPLAPSGDILFYDGTGDEVGSIPVNPDGAVIAPGEERVFTADAPAGGLFGKYKAYLTVDYGTANLASVHDTAFFYAVPLRTLIIASFVLIFFVGALSWWYHRRYLDADDDADHVHLHVREGISGAREHDIDLKRQ